MVSELIEKYVWLLQTLIDAGSRGLTFEEIQRKWERRFGGSYPRRTFNNHREAVAEVFGVWIGCRRGENIYFVDGGKDALDKDRSVGWMISTFTVGSLLSMGKERLSGRVSLENIPSGQIYLAPVIAAMTNMVEIEITYEKYGKGEPELLHVQPYAIKEFQSRWYVIGWCHERKAMRLYGLDRIHSLEATERKFTMPEDFSVDELFYRSFGPYLTSSEEKVETITFKASKREAYFFKDLPIHHTQKIVSEDPEGTVFEICLVPNESFYMEICRYGSRLEVLGPENVRAKVADEFSRSMSKYQTQ